MQYETTEKQNEVLSCILAQEPISFFFDSKAKTASFNMERREISMPLFKENVPSYVIDHFIIHEISHALETDKNVFDKAVENNLLDEFNVIEDFRIENIASMKYKGFQNLRNVSYRYLHQVLDFFGLGSLTNHIDIENYSFLERINVFYKCGHIIDVEFSDEEKEILNEIEACETSSDVFDICNKYFDTEDFSILNYGNERSISCEVENYNEESYEGSSLVVDRPNAAKTNLYEDLLLNTDKKIKICNFDINKTGTNKFLCSVENFHPDQSDRAFDILKFYSRDYIKDDKLFMDQEKACRKFSVNASNIFLAKMKAHNISRTRMSKTGILDPQSLFKYKTDTDLFKTKEITRNGKNHGVCCFLDFSGSMQGSKIMMLLKQVANLVMFCERLDLPYQIWSHANRSSGYCGGWIRDHNNLRSADPVLIISSDFNKKDRDDILDKLIYRSINSIINVAKYGTEIAATMYHCLKWVSEFKNKHKIECMHTIVMTDGQDTIPSEWESSDFISCNDKILYEKIPQNVRYSGEQSNYRYDRGSYIDVISRLYNHYINSPVSYLQFGSGGNTLAENVLKKRKIGKSITTYTGMYGIKRGFLFNVPRITKDYDEKINDAESSKKLATLLAKRNISDGMFINIFASAIADEGF